LDEATSHLDTGAESLVNQAIKRLSMTRITIAHRPQTLQMADRLIILGGANGSAELIAAATPVFQESSSLPMRPTPLAPIVT
jgi:ATP-binding cassette subfamily B protein RaxB